MKDIKTINGKKIIDYDLRNGNAPIILISPTGKKFRLIVNDEGLLFVEEVK